MAFLRPSFVEEASAFIRGDGLWLRLVDVETGSSPTGSVGEPAWPVLAVAVDRLRTN